MTPLHRAQLKLGSIAVVTVVVALVALRLAGVFVVGYVPTDSMEPTLPSGSLFLSLPLEPRQDSIVVYSLPTGERIVHRVVEVTEDGLVTQGDNNHVTDQARGWDPIDPDEVQVVPQPTGKPLAVASPIDNLVTVFLVQVALLGLAVFGGFRKTRGASRLRPHHLLAVAAVALMIAAPMFADHYEAEDEVLLQSSFLPVVAHVSTAEGEETWTLGPFESKETGMEGPANVTVAPALPGMRLLVTSGPFVAYAPMSVALALAAWGFRRMGV